MRQQTRPLKEPAEKVVQDIRRASIIRPRRRSGSCWKVSVARTALPSCAAARGSRRTCTIVGRKTSWTARAATLPGSVSQSFPEVPTAKQAGLDFEVSIWAGMFAPKGTPTNIVDKLANNLDAALEEPAVKNRLADLGVSSQKGGAFSRKIRQLCQI